MNTADQAADFVDLVKYELVGMSPTDRRIFLGVIDRFCGAHDDTPARPRIEAINPGPLNEQEAKRFEHGFLPDRFRKHAGEIVRNVPVAYLCWLVDPTPFIQELKSYLKSRRGQERIERDKP